MAIVQQNYGPFPDCFPELWRLLQWPSRALTGEQHGRLTAAKQGCMLKKADMGVVV